MKILISGAGIAGLSLARALMRRGMRPDIIERRERWNDEGTGIFLPGNATRAFERIGLLPEISSVARSIARQDFFDRSGRPLCNVDTMAFWNDCGPCLALPRSSLHQILRSSLRDLPVRTGRTVADIHHAPDGCEVVLDDGTCARYDLVVGADGLNSGIRRLTNANSRPTYSGNVCWRFLRPNTEGIDAWTVMIDRGRTLLAIPVDRDRVYVYADLVAPIGETRQYSARTDLKAIFAGFGAPLAPLLKDRSAALGIHFDRIETIELDHWSDRSVVLIGDAAHASSPSMAEGAGMACEDALVLAEELAALSTTASALERYRERRHGRLAWVAKQSRVRDRMRRWPTPISKTLLRYAGERLYAQSYRPLLGPM